MTTCDFDAEIVACPPDTWILTLFSSRLGMTIEEEEDGGCVVVDEDGRELDIILECGEVTGGKWWLSVDTVAAEEAKNFLRCSATVDEVVAVAADAAPVVEVVVVD